jgi:hypothetical protein
MGILDPTHGDRLWNVRRNIMLACLAFCAVFLIFCALVISAEKIVAMAALFTPVAAFAAPVLMAYMGIAEWGSIKKGTTTTEVAVSSPATTTIKKTEPSVLDQPVPRADEPET